MVKHKRPLALLMVLGLVTFTLFNEITGFFMVALVGAISLLTD